ncbi:MAG TPA: ABC transporter permease [Candidatus Saccharimonadales bacterium]
MKKTKAYAPAIVVICLLLLGWQLYTMSGFVSATTLPSPVRIYQTLVLQRAAIWGNSLQTIAETLIGLALAVVLGVIFGVVIFLFTLLRKAFYPILVASQTVPLIALAPLLLIWFGFGLQPKVIMVVLYCFFPITIAVADGLATADPQLVDLLKSMRASQWQTLRTVRIPAAAPAFFSGLKISATYAVTGAVVGEYVGASKGLGIYLQSAAHTDSIDLVFALITVIALLSLILVGLVLLMEKHFLAWRT